MEYESRLAVDVPKVGFGTWQLEPDQAIECVGAAIDSGYRHIDTAQLYGNERAVGEAIAESAVDREELFITTKVNPSNRSVDDIVAATEESLDRLGIDTIDLLLIHWPHPLANLETVMEGLDKTVEQSLTRYIGVSNFSVDRLERARELASEPIFTNQVLFHPWWPQRSLLNYCQEHDILLTAYSPLANGGAIDDGVLADIGQRYGKSAPQTAIRWVTQHENVITIPMSTSPAHIAENIDIFDFILTADEHERITRKSYLKTGVLMVRGQIGLSSHIN